MAESLQAARTEVGAQTTPPPATNKALLRDHSTKGFIREGKPFVRRAGPLVVPAENRSLFVNIPSCLYPIVYPKGVAWFGPENVADQYVLGLLARGYRWPEDVPAGNAESTPQRNAEASRLEKPPASVRLSHLATTPWELLYLQWEQSDKPGPYKKCNTAGKYILMPFITVAAAPLYLVGYYLPGGRLWDWQQVERDRAELTEARNAKP